MATIFKKSRIEKYRIKGTANAANDTAQMIACANAMFAYPQRAYEIEVHGSCYLDNIVQIRNPNFSWDFKPGAEFVRAGNLGIFQVSYDINIIIHQVVTGTLTQLDEDAFKLINFSGSVAKGDYVAIWSDSRVDPPLMSPHAPYTWYIPMEIHRLNRVITNSSPTAYLFKDTMYDQHISAKYRKLTMLNGVRWNGFKARALPGITMTANFINFRSTADFEMQDCDFACNQGLPAGALNWIASYDTRRHNIRMGDTELPNSLSTSPYGIVDGIGNRYVLADSELGDMRHCYTTGGQSGYTVWSSRAYTVGERVRNGTGSLNGTNRGYEVVVAGTSTTMPNHVTPGGASAAGDVQTYDAGIQWRDLGVDGGTTIYGTTKNFSVHGNKGVVHGRQDPLNSYIFVGQSAFDTHTDAVNGTFFDNEVWVIGETPNTGPSIGFTIRGRNCSVQGNKIYCHKDAIPIRVSGPDTSVSDNDIWGGLRCEIGNAAGYNPNVMGHEYTNNRHYYMTGPCVWVVGGGQVMITDNKFFDCGRNEYDSTESNDLLSPQALIYVASLNGTAVITGNKGERGEAQMAVAFGSTITADQIIKLDDNAVSEFSSPYNMGIRPRQWQSGLALESGDVVWHNGNEYRVVRPWAAATYAINDRVRSASVLGHYRTYRATTAGASTVAPTHVTAPETGARTGGLATVGGITWEDLGPDAKVPFTTSAAPVHTTANGVVASLQFRREIPIGEIIKLETKWGNLNNTLPSVVRNKSAHGLNYSDLWKPLNTDIDVWDDADLGQEYGGLILVDIIDLNNIRVIAKGMPFRSPASIIAGSYSIADGVAGRLYWDLSAGGFKAIQPGDQGSAPAILQATAYLSGADGYVHGVVL